MALFLRTSFSVSAKVIYDTPRPDFLKLAHANMHPDLRAQLFERVEACATRIGHAHIADELPIVITSTSWTPDEDFSLFFDALQQIDARKRRCTVVITGRGPLRAEYEERAHQMAFRNITLYFAWLHIEDYPRLLSLSTIGVSLHQSSSGLDLPMKAVDMLACGLPVLALRYHCIHELISHRRTGLLFHDAHGLAAMLEQLVFGSGNEIEAMRRNVREQFDHNNEWISYWQREALPTLVPNGRGNNT